MTIEMIALRRFRLVQAKGFVWLDAGEAYEVGGEETAEYHEKTGRGKRSKPASTSKKGIDK